MALLSLEQCVLSQYRGGVEAHLRAFLGVLGHLRREALVELQLFYRSLFGLFVFRLNNRTNYFFVIFRSGNKKKELSEQLLR